MSKTQATPVGTITHGLLRVTGGYGDFRDELHANGYAVIKGAIPRERAIQYQQSAFDWDPSTWKAENLPVQSKLNTFDNYGVIHEKFIFFRFAQYITFPNHADKPPRAPWPHIDQSPFKRGMHCIQGIINLSHAGPEDGSLMCLPRSSTYNDEFFDTQTDPLTWEKKDWRRFSEQEMNWWASKGLKPLKVQAEPGDLILWDSRTVHWGGEPTEKSDVIRTVIYASYSPARLATKEALEEKARVFDVYGATTHWAHDNIFLRPQVARLPDGKIDPRNRDEPVEKPEMKDRLKKLAGLIPY
ncbi:hypothetical protein N7493_005332 [Penicillium malachiteum]|uniref:Phytanoyl-CoA dioxygenase n=1 Tax=Penicillium malachiteum TaxID=1324776 RepID=A0AAD6MWQ8_9EURO|nr:hypothetical protein N7493_005332 [Penicillium malachiteum]